MGEHATSPFHVVFKVDTAFLAIQATQVIEILHIPELLVPPGLPSILEGFIQIANLTVPVIAMASILELPAVRRQLYTPIIIVQAGKEPMGFAVDDIIQITPIEPENISIISPEKTFNDCVYGAATVNAKETYLLNLERILLLQEQTAISSFTEKIQSRIRNLEKTNP